MNKFQLRHKKLIEGSNGIVDDIFVEKVGVLLTKKSQITSQAEELFGLMNIDKNSEGSTQHAEFNSRITYLSFNDEMSDSSEYNRRMIQEHGHRSVYNDEFVTFLVAGCSIETMTEFIAHNEATIARLTSSKTDAQNECLYRVGVKGISKEFQEMQKAMIKDMIKLRKNYFDDEVLELPVNRETYNLMNIGNKAVSFTITMSIKDWHKTLIGRLSQSGVELEMIEILNDIADILHYHYPVFFHTKEEYYAMGNEAKYSQK